MRAVYWTFSTSGLCSTSITKCEPAVSTVRGWRALRSSNSARCGPYRTRTGDLELMRLTSYQLLHTPMGAP